MFDEVWIDSVNVLPLHFFDKKKYKIRQVEIDNLGLLNIASTRLNDKLLCENGTYKSNEAAYIDEQVYFFERLYDTLVCEKSKQHWNR